MTETRPGPRVAVDLRALVGRPTGIGFFTQAVLEHLAREGRALLGLSHREITPATELRALGVALEHQPAPLGVLWQQLVLPRRLAAGDADVLWSPLFTLPVVSPLTVPAVVTVHDLTPVLFPETHRLKVRVSILPFLEASLDRARRVVADSRATAADLRRHFPECARRLEVVYPGVDPIFTPADDQRVAAIRRDLGCPGGYVFSAGTLEPRKNLGVLLDAWEALRREDAATPPLLLAGPYGWHSRALVRRLRALEPLGLRHLGHVDRPRLVELFQAARVFILPSLYEGFGLPAAEAMACGVPTIASNSSSLPEVVGDAGLLVAAGDGGGDLAAAMRRILTDPALEDDLGRRGAERARGFSWGKTAARMGEIFDRVAGTGGR